MWGAAMLGLSRSCGEGGGAGGVGGVRGSTYGVEYNQSQQMKKQVHKKRRHDLLLYLLAISQFMGRFVHFRGAGGPVV